MWLRTVLVGSAIATIMTMVSAGILTVGLTEWCSSVHNSLSPIIVGFVIGSFNIHLQDCVSDSIFDTLLCVL